MMDSLEKKVYYAVPYYRISNDDGDLLPDGKQESNSISNQRNLIEDFVKNKPDIILCEERVDDGFSGVNFERPAFKHMLEDIKAGKVNCVIVKDLSRLGRNYIEAGRYIQKLFPYLGVRFIAINDDYDSISSKAQSDNIIIPFKNLMNDSYSRDISTKVRSQLDIKRKKGDFIGSFAVYGYMKDEENKNHLVIDEYAASVVRDIYKWKLFGMSNDAIADKLNEMGIKSPMEYKKLNGMNFSTGFETGARTKWSSLSIKRILSNEVYLGHMIQGKRTTPNHKVKKVIEKAPDEWVKVENTHPSIICLADYNEVQKVLKMDTRVSPESNELYVLSGIVKCASCNENMVRKTAGTNEKKYHYRICSNYKKDKASCSSHIINENVLVEAVLQTLKQYISDIVDVKDMLKEIDGLPSTDDEIRKLDTYLLKETEELHKLQELKVSLYEDLADGIIDKAEYFELKKLYSDQILSIEKEILILKEEQEAINSNGLGKNEWIDYFLEHKNIEKLTRSIVIKLIDKIEVFEKGKINITFNFQYDYQRVINDLKGGVSYGESE